jgi:ABC-type iron transport system FetAB ATPase subunit
MQATSTSRAARDLEVARVSVVVEARALLRDVSFRLRPGERIALRGPSGCGKTSLLRGLAGLEDLDGGRVTLGGQSPHQLGWPCWRRQVTLVSQEPVIFSGTIRANLARPFRYRSAAGPFPEQTAQAWLERLGLARRWSDADAAHLSVGERQRVALVRALAVKPAVLLLDEPTSALDESARLAAETLVRERCDQSGLAAVVVTHLESQALDWCDTLLDLRQHVAEGREHA